MISRYFLDLEKTNGIRETTIVCQQSWQITYPNIFPMHSPASICNHRSLNGVQSIAVTRTSQGPYLHVAVMESSLCNYIVPHVVSVMLCWRRNSEHTLNKQNTRTFIRCFLIRFFIHSFPNTNTLPTASYACDALHLSS
jgi:hypothetical protein